MHIPSEREHHNPIRTRTRSYVAQTRLEGDTSHQGDEIILRVCSEDEGNGDHETDHLSCRSHHRRGTLTATVHVQVDCANWNAAAFSSWTPDNSHV